MNILIISDNKFLVENFYRLIVQKKLNDKHHWQFTCSKTNIVLLNDTTLPVPIKSIDVKNDYTSLIGKFDLIFSLHCKQLFPAELVNKVKCINVHPGYNPYNRGWFPQVFSILNNYKAGATIHEIDELLDHGVIIAQKEVVIESYDTSLSAYEKIQQAEVELLNENLENILRNTYQTIVSEEGNVNLKKDFNALLKIDLDKKVTMHEAIDYLRAMSHGNYKNAYFIDKKTGSKIFANLNLQKEETKSNK